MKKSVITWAVGMTAVITGLTSCGVDMPKETKSSFEMEAIECC